MNDNLYRDIKLILISARNKVYQTANFAMVETYWNIGKKIIDEQGGGEMAEYGVGLLKELSKRMTKEFGKGFTVTNLKYMRQFFLAFPNGHSLRDELNQEYLALENKHAGKYSEVCQFCLLNLAGMEGGRAIFKVKRHKSFSEVHLSTTILERLHNLQIRTVSKC